MVQNTKSPLAVARERGLQGVKGGQLVKTKQNRISAADHTFTIHKLQLLKGINIELCFHLKESVYLDPSCVAEIP